jgi:hypothetical protein
MTRVFAGWVLSALALSAAPLEAQTVLSRVLDAESGAPVTGALVRLLDAGDTPVRDVLTDGIGRAMFLGLAEGDYRVRVEMIGRETTFSAPFTVAGEVPVRIDVQLPSSAIALEGIEVRGEERCRVRPEEGLELARVWDEVRKALEAASLTGRSDVYRYQTEMYERDLDREGRVVLREERSSRDSFLETPFSSLPAERLAAGGYVQEQGGESMYYAPDAEVLVSDAFLDTHCLRLEEGDDEADGLLGVGFEPVPSRDRRLIDVQGVLWVDPSTAELKWLEYRYVNMDPDLRNDLVGGLVEFQRMPDGTWIVPEWWIRVPLLVREPGFTGNFRTRIDGFRQTGGRVVEVRNAGGDAFMRGETAVIEGFVQDSLGVFPRRGVRVGVTASSQMVFTDPEGRFRIDNLTDGVYTLRVVPPELEALGLEAPTVEQEATRGEVSTLYYRVPSVSELAFDACRREGLPEETAMLAGRVVDDDTGRPLASVTVRVAWERFWFDQEDPIAMDANRRGLATVTDERGRYRICGIPDGTLLYPSLVHDARELEADTLRIPEDHRAHLLDLRWEP